MKTSEKVAFIKGLMEGLSLDANKPETKILMQMADVLEELAVSNNALIEENIKLKDYIEEIDEDLSMVEDVVFSDDDDDYDYDDDDYDVFDDEDEYEFEEEEEDEEEENK